MPLFLKSLELQGYKTFAARSLFEFSGGINAIVGPNGSGKSNIADALRWVLGEQSYSILRAKRTEDMIFSGSEQRPRAGMASSTALFDNETGWLPVEFSEVAVSRRAYRDGRNEYFLNGQHVRLRQIYEMLAQSGLGERTYTVIGQGLVDASLALKADERRRLFEEAAGVGLYRNRREETLRRLEVTQRNLERVQDILAELAPRLRTLERQAQRAKEHDRVQADLRLLLRDWYGYHWNRVQKELADSRELLRDREQQLNETRSTYLKRQQDHMSSRERLQNLRAQLNDWHRDLSRLHVEREEVSRNLAVKDERRRALEESIQNLANEQNRFNDEAQLARERVDFSKQEFERLKTEFEEAQAEDSSAARAMEGQLTQRNAIEQNILNVRQLLEGLNTKRAESQARLTELESRISNYQDRLTQMKVAITDAEKETEQAAERFAQTVEESSAAEAAYAQVESELKTIGDEVAEFEKARQAYLDEKNANEAEKSRLVAKLDVLRQADSTLLGYAEGARFLLEAARQKKLKHTKGILGSKLDVPVELEVAIAAALGDTLDAVLLESGNDVEAALKILEGDSTSRAIILPVEWIVSSTTPLSSLDDPDSLGIAAGLVESSPEIRVVIDYLLGHVAVVKNRTAARRVLEGQPSIDKAVTLQGEVFHADGLVVAGKAVHTGTLSRPRQQREGQATVEEITRKITHLEESLKKVHKELAQANRTRANQAEALQKALRRMQEGAANKQQAALDLESAQRHKDWQLTQQERINTEILEAESIRQAVQKDEATQDAARTAALEESRALQAQLTELNLDDLQEQVTYWKTRLAVAERALDDAQTKQAEREQNLNRLEEQKITIISRVSEAKQTLSQLAVDKEELRLLEADLNKKIVSIQAQIDPAEKELDQAEKQEIAFQEQEANAQRALTLAERTHAQAQLELTRKLETLDLLRSRIEDDFGLVKFAYQEKVSGPLPLPIDGMVEQLPVLAELPQELEAQIGQQRALLRRMGPINPEAQKEYEETVSRREFLNSQVNDLRKAESDLRQVIAELDVLTQQDFKKTFHAVNEEFREIFVRLFGGGSAKLILTDPQDLTGTGIDIEARLPGRREHGLALLSGGERSLTAIALVFALLRVSPTPVCVLDEVDAMLDEANIARFRELLVELSQKTQFIIITHNRNTVQVADVIYGVTMGRDSTSQMISLRLDEVGDELLRD